MYVCGSFRNIRWGVPLRLLCGKVNERLVKYAKGRAASDSAFAAVFAKRRPAARSSASLTRGIVFRFLIALVDKFVLLLLLHVKIEGFFRIINFCVVGEIFN